MAAERLSMRQVKKVFYFRLVENKSQSEIATTLSIGKTTVREYLHRLHKSGLCDWATIEPLDEAELESRLGFTSPKPIQIRRSRFLRKP